MKMKMWIAFLMFTLQYATASAITVCDLKWQAQMEMNLISSNIANVNTTRTPEGGPYQKQMLLCEDVFCEVVELASTVFKKYEPDHPDATEFGVVNYPDINLGQELEDMIAAIQKYEEAAILCPD
jgi:flagellar basal body rod protein FlgC